MIKAKKPIKQQEFYEEVCDECGCELQFEEEDVHVGALGGMYVTCPECDNEVFVEDMEAIDINSKNIEFPTHFFLPSDDAVSIDDERIQEYVRQCLTSLECSTEDFDYTWTGSGDTMVFAFKNDEEYDVYVTKNYYECSIPR